VLSVVFFFLLSSINYGIGISPPAMFTYGFVVILTGAGRGDYSNA